MIGAIFMKFGRAPTTQRIGALLLLLDTDPPPTAHRQTAVAAIVKSNRTGTADPGRNRLLRPLDYSRQPAWEPTTRAHSADLGLTSESTLGVEFVRAHIGQPYHGTRQSLHGVAIFLSR